MQDIFTRAHQFVTRWEAGFVNHTNDPGGATNYGVSLRWLRSISRQEGVIHAGDIDGDGDVDIDDIRALTPEHARDLFRSHFWDSLRLFAFPPLVAVAVYDAAVNQGTGRAVRQLQTACNRQSGNWLAVDGVPGRNTLARTHSLCPRGQAQMNLCRMSINEREEFYRQLAAKPPFRNTQGQLVDYRQFLEGWLCRTNSLWGWLNQLASEGYA